MYKIRGDLLKYLEFIKDHFKIVENLNVIELGAAHGDHSQIILSHNPSSLTIVEPHPSSSKKLRERFPNVLVLQEDAFDTLSKDTKYDVVVCCGLLYHFHSPLYFLELIANNAQPKYIILETYTGGDVFIEEEVNVHGSRIVLNNKKSVKLSLLLEKKVLIRSLKDLGYHRTTDLDFKDIKDTDLPKAKNTTNFFIFEKVKD